MGRNAEGMRGMRMGMEENGREWIPIPQEKFKENIKRIKRRKTKGSGLKNNQCSKARLGSELYLLKVFFFEGSSAH
jgi:hypothetical protein